MTSHGNPVGKQLRPEQQVKTGHTPGLWVEDSKDGIPAVGIDPGDGGPLLPIVDRVHGRTKAEARRNRRLVAAAPELLEALIAALSDDQPYIAKARAAIAKATGDQP